MVMPLRRQEPSREFNRKSLTTQLIGHSDHSGNGTRRNRNEGRNERNLLETSRTRGYKPRITFKPRGRYTQLREFPARNYFITPGELSAVRFYFTTPTHPLVQFSRSFSSFLCSIWVSSPLLHSEFLRRRLLDAVVLDPRSLCNDNINETLSLFCFVPRQRLSQK